jgi:hypothetical protein
MRILLSLLVVGACAEADGQPRGPQGPQGPIVVELFTSQGCSSCPPADRLLASLAKDTAIAPLSFHVDYWNDLGWADPYSAPAWTARQHEYATALGDRRVYTPELVVGGAVGMVGSNAAQVRAAVDRAQRPALLAATGRWSKDSLDITTTAPADADVFVAVWEAERSVAVTRGENTGSTLANARIVRRFERVATAGKPGTITVKLDARWRDLGAVAFAQRADKRIVASALLPRS